MLSKAQLRFLNSLQQKKFRKAHQSFIVEGIKSVEEFVFSSYQVLQIYVTPGAVAKLPKIPDNIKLYVIPDEDFSKISFLTNPQGVLAVVQIPNSPENIIEKGGCSGQFVLALDEVQDPGNLGTIIRIADWYGIQHIVCSFGTIDAYNPKVVQASMGSLSRVKLHYLDLIDFFDKSNLPVFGAVLNGNSIYETDFCNEGVILLGNEGNGIGKTLLEKIKFPVTIPRFGGAESLNVGVSAAIFCSEIIRQKLLAK